VKRFLASGRIGFYLAVTREGTVAAGDEMELIGRATDSVPVSEVRRLYLAKTYSTEDRRQLEKLLGVAAFPESWKHYLREKLADSAPLA